jgi:AAA+ ATPase superfamily predicted ATPase
VDIDGLEAAQNYIRRATSGGGQFNRYELERMIPQFSGRADDDLLESIRSSKSLQELESLGEDPFGQLSRRMQESQSGADDLALKERELRDLYELGAGSKGIDAALRRLSGIR